MKILLLTDSYPPEIRSASHLMYELAHGLKNRGHDIAVATTMPQYNLTKEHVSVEYKNIMVEDGVTVIRVKTPPLHKVGYFKRGLAHLVLPVIFCRLIKRSVIFRPDIIIVYSPPLTLGIAGVRLKDYFKSKFILNIQDIFPQNAIDLGIISNLLIIRFFEAQEKWIYKRVDEITVHSEGNKEFLKIRNGFLRDKIDVVNNWANYKLFRRDAEEINFRKLYQLDSKMVILFAGVLGPAQGLDVVINVAKRIQDNSKVHFLFVGDGTEKKRLEDKVEKLNLTNVTFQPFVDGENYPFLLKSVDVGLVCLSSSNKTPVVPGKLMGYMFSGLPVLAFLNKESDGHKIIKDANCGFTFTPENEDRILEAVLKLEKDKEVRITMGKNAEEFSKKNFTLEAALDKYEKIFEILIGRRNETS